MRLPRTFQVLAMTPPSVIARVTKSAEAISWRGNDKKRRAQDDRGVLLNTLVKWLIDLSMPVSVR